MTLSSNETIYIVLHNTHLGALLHAGQEVYVSSQGPWAQRPPQQRCISQAVPGM